MSGKVFAIGLAVLALAFGAGLWWAQVHAYYERVDGLPAVAVGGVATPVAEYRGIDAESSPLRLRACFRLDPAALDAPDAAKPTPLIAPSWFDCFDAGRLTADLASGAARAVVAQRQDRPGVDRLIAVYPDGRAFMWRQLAED